MILIGDYNINYNQRNSRRYNILKSFERDTGLKQLITDNTLISQNHNFFFLGGGGGCAY